MQDRFGLVPAHIKAQVENEEALDRQVGTARYIDKALKAKDPYLGLVLVKHDVPEWELPTGAVAGRWHVERKNPGFVSTYLPIVGPNGEFREPDSSVLTLVDENDLHHPDIWRHYTSRQERAQEARAKAKELEAEQGRDEMVADLKAGWRVAGEGGLRKRAWGRG